MTDFDPDVTRHLSLLDVDEEIFTLGLDLVYNGFYGESEYILPYTGYPNAGYLFIELLTPDRSVDPPVKGYLRLLKHSQIDNYTPPRLNQDCVSKYTRLTYMDHDVCLHPRHIEYAKLSKEGKLSGAKIFICAIVCPERGAVTFDMG